MTGQKTLFVDDKELPKKKLTSEDVMQLLNEVHKDRKYGRAAIGNPDLSYEDQNPSETEKSLRNDCDGQSKEFYEWENEQAHRVVNPSKKAQVINPEIFGNFRDSNFKVSWHPDDGIAIIGSIDGKHSDDVMKYGRGKAMRQWVCGIYFKADDQFHTMKWFDRTGRPEAKFGNVANDRSELIQRQCSRALRNMSILPKDVIHIMNSDNEVTMKLIGKESW